MANTTVLSGLELTKWQKKFMREFVRESGFEPYMGTSPMDIIRVVNDLTTDGYTIRTPLVKALKNDAVEGESTLSGNEESMDQYYQDVTWEFYRNAIRVSKKQREKSAVELVAEARPLLREWAAELVKYQIIDNMHAIDGLKYSAASQAQRDAWLVRNADRALFGATTANNASNDHSAALATIDATNDKLTVDQAMLAKRLARIARPRIKPFKNGADGKEYFVMFCNPICFRDLKQSTAMEQANREARARNVDSNPLFQDGDLIYDGVIFREMVEFQSPKDPTDTVNAETFLDNVGASSIDVGANFLCGAQALCMANKQAPMPVVGDDTDYNFYKGIGIELAHGIEKMTWNNGSGNRQDCGVFTVYSSAAA